MYHMDQVMVKGIKGNIQRFWDILGITNIIFNDWRSIAISLNLIYLKGYNRWITKYFEYFHELNDIQCQILGNNKYFNNCCINQIQNMVYI